MNYLLKAYIENEITDNVENITSIYENEEWACGLQDAEADQKIIRNVKLRRVLAILDNKVNYLEITDDDLYEVEEIIEEFREYSVQISVYTLDNITYGVEMTRDEANREY